MSDDDDPLARVRERRFRAIVDELLPKLRRINPLWTDEEILDHGRVDGGVPAPRQGDGMTPA